MSDYSNIELPKKIRFTFDTGRLDSSLKEILEPFYKLAERELYEWEKTDFPLPASIFSGLNVKRFDLGIKDYLNIDECKQLAKDSNGQPKPLSKPQLQQLRETGTFKVQSAQFPDKYHVWKIHSLLQKGTIKVYADYRKDVSRVINLMIITAWNRVIRRQHSIRSSGVHMWRGLYLLIDLLFGLPHNNSGNIDTKIGEECLQFLTCELNVSKTYQSQLHQFWDYLEQLSCLPKHCGLKKLKEYFPIYIEKKNIPFGIYQFLTPDHLPIDFRLANMTLRSKCLDIVTDAIKEVEESDWFIDYRKSYIDNICDDSYSLDVVEKDLKKTGLKARMNKVYEIIQTNCKKSDIPDAICEIMIENAKYCLICCEVETYLKEMWLALRSETLETLQKTHPFFSQTSIWVRKQLKKTHQQFVLKHEFTKMKMVIDRCAAEQLRQHEYFSKRYLLFMKERKPLMQNELVSKSSFPDRQYCFKSKMILPQYWKVSETTDNNGQKVFEVDKNKAVNWTSRYPGWRWINYFLNTYIMILIVGQFLLIKVPFKTPVSYLSLFLRQPFSTKHEFSSRTGLIKALETDVVPTLCSRLVKLWFYVWECRYKFENSAFSGLLDKSVARHFHRLWVVVLQGGMGTLGIVLIMPILCIFFSSLCCVIGVLVPLWIPLVTFVMYLGGVIFYDFQKAERHGNRILRFFEATIWHIFLCGICQLCIVVVLLIVILPLLACLFFVWAIVRISVRYVWDSAIFYMVLRRHAHVPAANDFVSKRISGPGLAYDYEILVKPEHVLLGLRCLLEKEELDLWLRQVTAIIKQPLVDYESFITTTLGPLAVTISHLHHIIQRLQRVEQDSLSTVNRDYYDRIEMLNIKPYIASDKDGKLRLSSKDLQIVLEKSEKLCEHFYAENLKPKITNLLTEEMDWWTKRNIKTGDFRNLAVNSLSYLFGEQILSSIEDCDEVFHLEVNSLTVSAYMNMFVSETYGQDFDQQIVDETRANQNIGPEHLQIKLRNFMLPPFSATDFFGHENETFPTALISCPEVKYRKRSRRRIFTHLRDWMKCCSNYYESVDSDEAILSVAGPKAPWDLAVYHPLIICTLLHSRDRDNSMINHEHRAVVEGINDCLQLKYRPDFFDTNNMTQSIDYSQSSLDNLSQEIRPSLIL